jgi:hypothetical protein
MFEEWCRVFGRKCKYGKDWVEGMAIRMMTVIGIETKTTQVTGRLGLDVFFSM